MIYDAVLQNGEPHEHIFSVPGAHPTVELSRMNVTCACCVRAALNRGHFADIQAAHITSSMKKEVADMVILHKKHTDKLHAIINTKTYDSETLSKIRYLLDQGACTRKISTEHNYLLHELTFPATSQDKDEAEAHILYCQHIASLLLHHGLDINARDDTRCDLKGDSVNITGYTALHMATKLGNKDMVNFLLESGANMNIFAGTEGRSAIHVACRQGHIDIVCLLRQFGATLKDLDGRYATPLINACERGKYATVKFLLREGADINAIDKDKWTPLHSACFSRNPQSVLIINALVAAGADIHATDSNGMTPLHAACSRCNLHTAVTIQALLNVNVDVNAISDYGNALRVLIDPPSGTDNLPPPNESAVRALIEAGVHVLHADPVLCPVYAAATKKNCPASILAMLLAECQDEELSWAIPNSVPEEKLQLLKRTGKRSVKAVTDANKCQRLK